MYRVKHISDGRARWIGFAWFFPKDGSIASRCGQINLTPAPHTMLPNWVYDAFAPDPNDATCKTCRKLTKLDPDPIGNWPEG